ncbi:MAG TPA: phosphatase PAP2 family protein [Terriglobales bacterium]|nr:phosphatase PAP2 family protein [Terriglobales bacterium]
MRHTSVVRRAIVIILANLVICCAWSQNQPAALRPITGSASRNIESGLSRFRISRPNAGLASAFPVPQENGTNHNGVTPWTATRDSNNEGFFTRAFKRGLEDQKEIWTAPFHRANLKWDALMVAGTGTLVAYDEQILRDLPNSNRQVSLSVSNGIIVGTGVTLGSIFFISGLHGGNEHSKETGVLAIESLANTFLVYTPLQLITGRQRPNEGTGEGSFFRHHSVNESFPGGHSMFEFAMATTIAHEYPRWWVQVLAYGAASALTGARMTAKMHFPSDLLVGGALGYLISTHIFHAHCDPSLSDACHGNGP